MVMNTPLVVGHSGTPRVLFHGGMHDPVGDMVPLSPAEFEALGLYGQEHYNLMAIFGFDDKAADLIMMSPALFGFSYGWALAGVYMGIVLFLGGIPTAYLWLYILIMTIAFMGLYFAFFVSLELYSNYDAQHPVESYGRWIYGLTEDFYRAIGLGSLLYSADWDDDE